MPKSEEKKEGRETRGIKLDYSTLGDKITMSSATCHKCKVTIPLNLMNMCSGRKQISLMHQSSMNSTGSCKRARQSNENNDACKIRFCDTCLLADQLQLQKQAPGKLLQVESDLVCDDRPENVAVPRLPGQLSVRELYSIEVKGCSKLVEHRIRCIL